jgi:hypothetical protein
MKFDMNNQWVWPDCSRNFSDAELLAMTDEELVRLTQDEALAIEHNRAIRADLESKKAEIIRFAESLWGKSAKIVKALHRESFPQDRWANHASDVRRKVQDLRRKAERARDEVKSEASLKALTERAVIWLQAKGKVLGQDFSLDNALTTANGIASAEEEKRLAEVGGWHEFQGQNCEGDCAGWDGHSNRCQCGNRRVYWEADIDFTFENPHLCAVAY